MYGCAQWGKGHTCPSSKNSLKPWEYELILKKYKWGIIIYSQDKKAAQDVSYQIEKEAILKGYYFAISFSNCAICDKCRGFRGQACANPVKARPEFHSVGIDVYKTVRKFELPIQVLKSKDEQPNWYSAIFIE